MNEMDILIIAVFILSITTIFFWTRSEIVIEEKEKLKNESKENE